MVKSFFVSVVEFVFIFNIFIAYILVVVVFLSKNINCNLKFGCFKIQDVETQTQLESMMKEIQRLKQR